MVNMVNIIPAEHKQHVCIVIVSMLVFLCSLKAPHRAASEAADYWYGFYMILNFR